MSRPFLTLALAVLLVAGIAPIAVMLLRMAPEDLARLADARYANLLGRTLLLGGGAAAVALLLGLPFAFFTVRADIPLANALRSLGVIPLVLPPLILSMTWIVLSDLRGAPMTILLLGLGTFPLVALFSGRAMGRIDARREEAARLVGGLRAVIRMELPLVLPSALCGACFAFIFAINDFAVPDYVSSLGPKFNVYADEIFAIWGVMEDDGLAVATALPLIALTLLSLIPALVLRRKGAMATVDTDFIKPARLGLGPWRWPAFLFSLSVVCAGALIPIGRLIFEAGGGARLTQAAGDAQAAGAAAPAAGWSLQKLSAAFSLAIERAGDNLLATMIFAALGATLAVPFALALGHAIERARRGRLLELAAVLPIAVPSILFAIGNIAIWNNDYTAAFYGGEGLVVLMLVGRFLPFPILVASGAVASLDKNLEESAQLAGAGPFTRLVRIVAPNIWTSLCGGWALVYMLIMRELDAAILIPSANQMVMIRVFNGVHFGRDDFVAALCLLVVFTVLLPGLCWSLFTQRRLEYLP